MRLLDRYLLRELLIPLGYCLGGFLIFWIAFDLFNHLGDFQDRRMSGGDVAEYYLVITPEFLVMVLPITLLLALLYALTNHARHQEITAIRAAGVSLWRLCLPYLGVGLFISLVSLAINELWVPDSADAAEQIRTRHTPPKAGALGPNQVRGVDIHNKREGRFWHIPIFNHQTGEMINPVVFFTNRSGWSVSLSAKRAIYTNSAWLFYDVSVIRDASPTNSYPVPLLETNALAMPEFSETPEQIRSEIKVSNGISLRSSKKADVPIAEIINYLRLHPDPPDAAWLYTKLQGRLAAPWTCVVVVLIAVPFGAASGRRNVFFGVAGSIFICFAYFVLQQIALALGTGGYLPAWLAAWSPNLSFAIAGIWMTARVR